MSRAHLHVPQNYTKSYMVDIPDPLVWGAFGAVVGSPELSGLKNVNTATKMATKMAIRIATTTTVTQMQI